MEADNELSAILQRRQSRNDALVRSFFDPLHCLFANRDVFVQENGGEVENKFVKVNIYTEFKDFSRQQIKNYEAKFKQ